ncbi:hypothetical protein SLS57_002130 [Botryosphaeria dothidea]
MAFLPLGNARHFVASRSPEEIAKRMREDAALVDTDERCSWIAFHLPQRNTSEALAIATHLVPSPDLSDDVKNLVYENLVSKLRRHLDQDWPPRNEPVFAANEPPNRIPISDLATALKVLTHLQHDRLIEPSTPVSTLTSWLQKRTAAPTPPDTPEREPTPTEGGNASKPAPSLFEIPYEDVISAHAVNTFVPLILCRELLPLMGGTKDPSGHSDTGPLLDKPEGYIINVSSREGIFEDRTNSTAKGGKHVHTNMSKAALNMITETESATAWQTRRVAMNTVDPGYMSAAPEYEDAFDGIRPIGWEDGAGRVLWPVAMGEMEGEAIWGRFLKHYGAVHVDPGAGRG